jgi:hypothetical protein
MTTTGVPGIPDDLELEAMASGTPRGVRLSSAWYEPPAGTALSSLEGATMTFQPRAFGPEAFGFDLKDWGIEYDLVTTSGGSEAGPAEEELCVPSAPCEALRAD